MRLEPCAAMAVLLALTACGGSGKKDEAGQKSGASAPVATAPAVKLNPGQWEMVIQAGMTPTPGMPPEVAKMMKNTTMTTKQCITPEEANQPTNKTFGGKMRGDCKQSEFSLAGGKIHSVISCTGGSGGRSGATITSDGEYGGDAFDVRSKIVTDNGPGGEMTMESHVAAHRVGECTGKEAG